MLHLAVESSKVGNLQRLEEVFHYCLSTTWIKVSPKPFAYTYEGTYIVCRRELKVGTAFGGQKKSKFYPAYKYKYLTGSIVEI